MALLLKFFKFLKSTFPMFNNYCVLSVGGFANVFLCTSDVKPLENLNQTYHTTNRDLRHLRGKKCAKQILITDLFKSPIDQYIYIYKTSHDLPFFTCPSFSMIFRDINCFLPKHPLPLMSSVWEHLITCLYI